MAGVQGKMMQTEVGHGSGKLDSTWPWQDIWVFILGAVYLKWETVSFSETQPGCGRKSTLMGYQNEGLLWKRHSSSKLH